MDSRPITYPSSLTVPLQFSLMESPATARTVLVRRRYGVLPVRAAEDLVARVVGWGPNLYVRLCY